MSAIPLNPIRKDYDDAEAHTEEDATLLDQSSGRARQGSVHFDFNTIQLSLSGVESGESSGNKSRKSGDYQVELIGGIALVVGLQLGSKEFGCISRWKLLANRSGGVGGIFASPGVVLRETGSVNTALLIWGIAGALNWAGASSFAELGTSIPLNGGAQACQSLTILTSAHPSTSVLSLTTAANPLCRSTDCLRRARVVNVLRHSDRLLETVVDGDHLDYWRGIRLPSLRRHARRWLESRHQTRCCVLGLSRRWITSVELERRNASSGRSHFFQGK